MHRLASRFFFPLIIKASWDVFLEDRPFSSLLTSLGLGYLLAVSLIFVFVHPIGALVLQVVQLMSHPPPSYEAATRYGDELNSSSPRKKSAFKRVVMAVATFITGGKRKKERETHDSVRGYVPTDPVQEKLVRYGTRFIR
jgi:hypothetical protein